MDFKYSRKFGFLLRPTFIETGHFSVSPLDCHAEIVVEFEKHVNSDGYFYPPQVSNYELDPATMEPIKKVERTTRPALVFPLPCSHLIAFNKIGPEDSADAFVTNLLAFVYGTRLQFEGWRIDGRVPLKNSSPFSISDSTATHFICHAFESWRRQSEEVRTRLINTVYMLVRARTLEWDWDAFIHQYLVFDSIYKLHTMLRPKPQRRSNHRERFYVLMSEYGVAKNDEMVEKIYSARNDLFHEAMWVGSTIGFEPKDIDARQYHRHLNRLNSRLLCRLLGYFNNFSASGWWYMGASVFDELKHGSSG